MKSTCAALVTHGLNSERPSMRGGSHTKNAEGIKTDKREKRKALVSLPGSNGGRKNGNATNEGPCKNSKEKGGVWVDSTKKAPSLRAPRGGEQGVATKRIGWGADGVETSAHLKDVWKSQSLRLKGAPATHSNPMGGEKKRRKKTSN